MIVVFCAGASSTNLRLVSLEEIQHDGKYRNVYKSIIYAIEMEIVYNKYIFNIF